MVYLYQAYCLLTCWVHCGKHPLCLTKGAREQKGDWSNNSGEIQRTDLLFVNTRNCMKSLQLFQGRKSLLFSREFWWISMQFSSCHNSFLKEIVIQLNATPDIIRNVGENITTGLKRKFNLLSCRASQNHLNQDLSLWLSLPTPVFVFLLDEWKGVRMCYLKGRL